MLVMYDMDYSPTCAKVRKLMDYKGLTYRKVPVPYHDKRRLIRETGQDYVPFLKDGRRGAPWPEAVDYLDRVAPPPPAYPGDSRAVVRILESWEYDWFEDRLWPFVAAFPGGALRAPAGRGGFGGVGGRPDPGVMGVRLVRGPAVAFRGRVPRGHAEGPRGAMELRGVVGPSPGDVRRDPVSPPPSLRAARALLRVVRGRPPGPGVPRPRRANGLRLRDLWEPPRPPRRGSARPQGVPEARGPVSPPGSPGGPGGGGGGGG